MRVSKILTTSVTAAALAFSMLASAIPASAATPGYHAAWVAQSAYATASPGQTVQMSAVYQNTGDAPWIKGTAGQQANFGAGSSKDPAYPRDTTAYADAGWSQGMNWLSANRFAAQANDLVATSGLGSWVWSVKVPTTQAPGVINFNGEPVVDGTTWMEDYGFFLQVTVVSGTVMVNSTTPASPSSANQPVVNGSSAPANGTVSLWDGATQVGTGTADASGNFAIATTPLAEGSHTLSATAVNSTGAFFASGNSITYVVDRTAGSVTSVTAPGTKTIVVVFSEAMNSSSTSASGAANPANYLLDGVALPGGSTISASSDKTTYTITLGTAMAQPSGHTLTVKTTLIADLAGNVGTSDTTVPFTVNDTTGPALSSASASAASGSTTTTVTATWSEPIQCVGTYDVDGVTAAAVAAGSTANTCTITSSQTLAAGSTHTLNVANEKDTAGNRQSPNPASASFTVSTATATITIVSSSATGETSLQIVWSGKVAAVPTGTYTVRTPDNTTIANTAARDSSNTSAVDLTLAANTFSTSGCNGASQTSCTLTVDVTSETGANGETQSAPILVTSMTVTKDTTAPTLVRVDQTTVGDQTNFDIVWSEPVSAPTTADVKIKQGTTIVASTNATDIGAGAIALTVTDGTASDSKTHVLAASNIPGGSYTLTVAAGLVTDLSLAANANAAGSIPMSVTDTTRPTVTAFAPATCAGTTACRQLTVTFSEKMATSGSGSVLDISHYAINGAAITGTASVDSTGTILTISLASTPPLGADQLSITGVTDTAGNLLNPNPTLENFTRTS